MSDYGVFGQGCPTREHKKRCILEVEPIELAVVFNASEQKGRIICDSQGFKITNCKIVILYNGTKICLLQLPYVNYNPIPGNL